MLRKVYCAVLFTAVLATTVRAQWSQPSPPDGAVTSPGAANVGIGVPNPAAKLEVKNSIIVSNTNTGAGSLLALAETAGTGATPFFIQRWGSGHSTLANGVELWNANNGFLRFATNNIERLRIDANGNVGIGTTTNNARLDVRNRDANGLQGIAYNDSGIPYLYGGLFMGQHNSASFATELDAGFFANSRSGTAATGTVTNSYGVHIANSINSTYGLVATNNVGMQIEDQSNTNATNNYAIRYSGPAPFAVLANGNVGIGNVAPVNALDVIGNATFSGTVTGGNIVAKYQDVAEWVPATEELSVGSVVVLDSDHSNHVLASRRAYDTSVAGVVSAQPGIVLGEAAADKAKVATTGRVRIKVDASRPIRIGDLLVTSDVPGTAMRSEPIEVAGAKIHRPGTIIGKALEPLDHGRGEILALLSLQ